MTPILMEPVGAAPAEAAGLADAAAALAEAAGLAEAAAAPAAELAAGFGALAAGLLAGAEEVLTEALPPQAASRIEDNAIVASFFMSGIILLTAQLEGDAPSSNDCRQLA
ncbi:MAG: hypothetical protein ACHQ7M_09680 [Chloroflexota bacterium]